jgi:hypothetical protein
VRLRRRVAHQGRGGGGSSDVVEPVHVLSSEDDDDDDNGGGSRHGVDVDGWSDGSGGGGGGSGSGRRAGRSRVARSQRLAAGGPANGVPHGHSGGLLMDVDDDQLLAAPGRRNGRRRSRSRSRSRSSSGSRHMPTSADEVDVWVDWPPAGAAAGDDAPALPFVLADGTRVPAKKCALCGREAMAAPAALRNGVSPAEGIEGAFLPRPLRVGRVTAVWVHANCAAFSPRVKHDDDTGRWYNVKREVRRGGGRMGVHWHTNAPPLPVWLAGEPRPSHHMLPARLRRQGRNHWLR